MKISKFVKTAVSAAVLVGASIAANASTYTLTGAILPGFTKSFGAFGGGSELTSFSDVFNFSFGAGTASSGYSASSLDFDLGNASFKGSFTSVGLYDATNTLISQYVSAGTKNVSVGNVVVASGAYSLKVAGTIDAGGNGYFYTGSVSASSISPVTPVPEPETYAMLLAGLGLMGAIARRRNKA